MKFAKLGTFLSLTVMAVLWFVATSSVQTAFAEEVALQDSKLLVAFDRDSGALTRLEDKSHDWVIERCPKLGISFRLHAPLPDQRATWFKEPHFPEWVKDVHSCQQLRINSPEQDERVPYTELKASPRELSPSPQLHPAPKL